MPFSVSLYEIPDGTKLPYFTSDMKNYEMVHFDFGHTMRYYNGKNVGEVKDNIFTDTRHNQDHNKNAPNSRYKKPGIDIEFQIWTSNNGTGYLTVWEPSSVIDTTISNPKADAPWRDTVNGGLAEEGRYIYDKVNNEYKGRIQNKLFG